jgi:hypothetical protein
LWNPHIYAGNPFLGTQQSGQLYPFYRLVLLFFSPLTLWQLFVVCHSWLLHAGWIALWRRLSSYSHSHWIGLLTGCVLITTPTWVGRIISGHATIMVNYALLPWMMYLLLPTEGY